MCRIKVLNKHHGHVHDGDRKIYIGRGSPLGNPFPIEPGRTRDQAIDAYHSWIVEKIRARDRKVCDALNHIATKALDGGVDLICFCALARCHGDVIKEIVTRQITQIKA